MTDLEIIQEIEKEIGKPISRENLDELEENFFGEPAYALKEKSEVVGLRLWNVGLRRIKLIGELRGLTHLNLGWNQLTDISALKELRGITALNLYGNQLTDISVLKELRGLNTLYLYGNQLTDISVLKELRGLTSLNLADNELTDISVLKELRGLTVLDLSFNRLPTVSFVLDMPNLRTLVLWRSEVADLPEHLYGKLLVAKLDDIRSFYRQKAKKIDRLFEAKVLFVGEPAAGKTSLMKKLVDPGYQVDPKQPEESTLGITVHMNWPFTYNNQTYKAHLWDFGGQQIQYYSTSSF